MTVLASPAWLQHVSRGLFGAERMDPVLSQVETALGSRYRVERELGRGGMATVYLAEDLKHHRQVAVKVLRPELSAAVAEKRFLQEIDIAAHLSHPNVLSLHDSGEGEGLVYYVMPYVDGGSLRDRLSSGVQIPVGEALRIVHAVADALAYAHSRALVHRDIKPENILFQADHPVVSDFGIARALAKAGASTVTQAGVEASGSGNSLITDVGLAVGTPAYISPEQASGSEVDHRADIYALGVAAYELLSGSPPFIRNTSQQTIAAHVTELPRPLGEIRESVPTQVTALVMSCLEKDPAKRPQSATEVMQVLETVSGLELRSSARTDARLAAKGALVRALGIYALAFVAVGATAWSAMMGLGLPDWVFPGALLVMAAGLPAIFLTAWVHYSTHATPAFTPTRNTPNEKTLAAKLLPHVTWRRTSWGTVAAIVLFVLSVSGFMTMRAAGIGPAATLITAGKLEPNDRLVVANFATHGADSSLGPTLASAARAALEQSAAVRVLSATEVAEVLRRMEKPATTRVDLEVAREIAIREGIRAIVGGEVSGVGQRFLITVGLFEARSGAALVQETGVARGADDLIAMIDQLSRKLRSRIGESLRFVRVTPPLAQVTTASLDALEKHTAGTKALVEGDEDKAVQLLREATTIDTGFAMSWRALAAAMGNAGIRGPTRDSVLRAAFRHKDRATPLERDLISAFYYWNVERDRAKAATAYEAVAQRDSGSPQLINLQQIYWSRRDFARAEQWARDILRRKPHTTIALINLVEALCDQGKYREADSAIAAAGTLALSEPGLLQWRARLLYYQDRLDDYGRALDTLSESSKPAVKRFAFPARAGYSLLRGRVRAAIDQRATARRNGWAGATEPAAVDLVFAARANGEILGHRDVAKRQLDSLTQQFVRSPVGGGFRSIAIAYAVLGYPREAQAAFRMHQEASTDPVVQRNTRDLDDYVLGEIALATRNYAGAERAFRDADMRTDGPANSCSACLSLNLARVFDAAGNVDSAIARYDQYLKTPSTTRPVNAILDPMYRARVHERLAQLYDTRQERARAMEHYRTFVFLWSTADAELQPRVKLARDRIRVLSDQSGP